MREYVDGGGGVGGGGGIKLVEDIFHTSFQCNIMKLL